MTESATDRLLAAYAAAREEEARDRLTKELTSAEQRASEADAAAALAEQELRGVWAAEGRPLGL